MFSFVASLCGISLVGTEIWSFRNVVLEEFTLHLANEYSKAFGSGRIDDQYIDPDAGVIKRCHSDPDFLRHLTGKSKMNLDSDISGFKRFLDPLDTLPVDRKGKRPIRLPESADSRLHHQSHRNEDDNNSSIGGKSPDINCSADLEPQIKHCHSDWPLEQPTQRKITISRSSKFPEVTIVAQDGILAKRHILKETKSKIYSQIKASFSILILIVLLSSFVFSTLESWSFFEGINFSH